MKIKRRLQAIVLVIAFLLANIPYGYNSYAEERSKGEINELYQKNVKVLKDLMLIYDAEDYLQDSQKKITRADAAYAAAKLLNLETSESSGFEDVSTSHWAYDQIGQATSNHIMEGTQKGSFSPYEAITLNDTATTLAKALCFGLMGIQGREKFVTNVVTSTAAEITSGVQTNGIAETTREQFVKLIMNAMEADSIEISSLGTGAGSYYEIQRNKNQTILSKRHDIFKVKGIIKANEDTALINPMGVDKDKVQINEDVFDIGLTHIADFLGYNVTAYIKQDSENEQGTVVTFFETNNNILTLKDDDIKSVERYSIGYLLEDDTKTATLSRYSDVIYNGVMLDKATGNDFQVQDGYLTLIDNDNDNKYDVAVVNAFDNYVVKSADWTNKKIYDTTQSRVLDIDETNTNMRYKLGDKELTREEFEKFVEANDILTILKSKNTEGTQVISFFISFDKVDGTITETDYKDFIVLDEKKYPLINALETNDFQDKYKIGDSVEVFLNSFGKVVYIKASSEQTVKYGYLLNASRKKGLGDDGDFSIFDEKGKVLNVKGADKISFNGDRMAPGKAIDALKSTGFKSQLVKYRIEGNMLSDLYTAKIGPDDGKFSLDCVMTTVADKKVDFEVNVRSFVFNSTNIDTRFNAYYDTTYGVEFSTGVNARAILVSKRDANGIISKDNINWIDEAALTEGSKWDQVSVYDVDEGSVAAVSVIEELSASSTTLDFRGANYHWFAVDRVTRRLNADGEAEVTVLGYHEGKERAYTLEKLVVEETINGQLQVNTYPVENYSQFINAGDVLQVKVNSSNEIENFRRIFTYSSKNPNHFDQNTIYQSEGYKMVDRQSASSIGTTSGALYMYGKVVGRSDGGKITIKTAVGGKDVYRARTLVIRNDVFYYVIDKHTNQVKLRIGKPDEVIGDEMAGSTVLVQSRITGLIDIVILK